MPDRYSHLLRALCEQPWAILPSALEVLAEIIVRRVAGDDLPPDEKAARIEAARRLPPASSQPGSIAVLPLFGLIAPRASMVQDISNPGTSADAFGAEFTALVNNPEIAAIVLQVDSPGGSVFGIQELGDVIYSARGTKPIVAAVDTGMAASAAYWLASQADELVMSPSSQVGSIGVIAAHDDISKAAEMKGIKRTYLTAGKHKAEANPFAPLSDEDRDALLARIGVYYEAFADAVARGRGVSVKAAKSEQFAEGRMVTAGAAIEARMADRIETIGQTIQRLAARQAKAGGVRAEGEGRELAAARLRLAAAGG